jgi:hypothetical protein
MSKFDKYDGVVNIPEKIPEKRGRGRPVGSLHPSTELFLQRLSRAAGIINEDLPEELKLAVDENGELALEVEILKAINGTTEAPRRAELYMKVLEYIVPKRKAVEVSGPDGGPIELDYSGLAAKFDRLVSEDDE